MDSVLDWIEGLGDGVGQSFVVLVVAAVVWWLFRRYGARTIGVLVARGSDKHALEREQRANTLWTAARRVAAVLGFLTVVITLLSIWNVPITGLLAVGSVVGVAIGFGAQSLVADVIAGFFIIIEDQYGIGDVVDVGGASGTVEDIQLRVTVLRDLDGVVHYVPNGQVKLASNRTQDFSQVVVDVGVAYETDIEHALTVMDDELARFAGDPRWSAVVLEAPTILGVDKLSDSSVVLRGLVKVLPDDRWLVKREIYRRIKLRFDADGIVIPYPQIAAHIHHAAGEG